MKRLISTVFIILVIGLFVYFNTDNWSYSGRIYKNEINSHITKIEANGSRFKVFFAEKSNTGFKLNINEDISFGYSNFFYTSTFNITEPLLKGDSLSKPAGSLQLSVFKKDSLGKPIFYKTFKGEK
ncbi:hypothetical protein SAMN05428975_4461 [Mucilaginibacter sp. OK268]|uniref:hypothetical protein n=1 Tax=Mucilaginibacter sp. OK268 TaxID=1881048 RepID=UPI00087EEC9A|nr:hypothetical protein [Mucilaginibacter sp. OK268]SDP97659.1 hypothetical protein SAMN05428975_4461 [Mucilaginibacter sp. OK268]